MTPSQIKKTREFIAAWVRDQKKRLGLSVGQLAELIGRPEGTTSRYLHGHLVPNFDVILTLTYEADCTASEIQSLFDAYANIRMGK